MDLIEHAKDQDNLLMRNSINYLYNLTRIKQLNVPALKSLYRTKSRLMELRSHNYLPTQSVERCKKCFLNFTEGKTGYTIQPIKLSTFAKKLLMKVKKKGVLTKFQKRYYRKLEKFYPVNQDRLLRHENKMVITCGFCHKKTFLVISKPLAVTKKQQKNSSVKKKQKAKKDKFCGLNENAVMESVSKRKNLFNNTQNNNDTTPTTSNTLQTSKNMMNASMSLAATRMVSTSDFIPLETKTKRKIKFSKKKPTHSTPVPIPSISKSKEKLQKKNNKNLDGLLKKANQNKSKTTLLQNFLSSL